MNCAWQLALTELGVVLAFIWIVAMGLLLFRSHRARKRIQAELDNYKFKVRTLAYVRVGSRFVLPKPSYWDSPAFDYQEESK